MFFVFRGTETRRRRVLLAHVRPPFCLPIVLASGEVIEARSQVDPNACIGRAASFRQCFGRELVGSRGGGNRGWSRFAGGRRGCRCGCLRSCRCSRRSWFGSSRSDRSAGLRGSAARAALGDVSFFRDALRLIFSPVRSPFLFAAFNGFLLSDGVRRQRCESDQCGADDRNGPDFHSFTPNDTFTVARSMVLIQTRNLPMAAIKSLARSWRIKENVPKPFTRMPADWCGPLQRSGRAPRRTC